MKDRFKRVVNFYDEDGFHKIRNTRVLIAGLGGSQGGAVGSMHGIKYKVIAVNGVPLSEILKGKKEKAKEGR